MIRLSSTFLIMEISDGLTPDEIGQVKDSAAPGLHISEMIKEESPCGGGDDGDHHMEKKGPGGLITLDEIDAMSPGREEESPSGL